MKKFYIISTVVLVLLVLFSLRIAYFQLFTDRYILNADNTSIKREVIHPRRGDILDRNGVLLVSNNFSYDLMLNTNLLENIDTAAFREVIGFSESEFDSILTDVYNNRYFYKNRKYLLKRNLDRETFAYLQEQLYLYPAAQIEKRPTRKYHVSTAGNILGYINEASPSYIKRDSLYYDPGDIVGISGVEYSYEKELRGVKGIHHVLKDIHQKSIGSYKNGRLDNEVEGGKTLNLTIDYKLQLYAEQLLQNKRGAVVAIDPTTGEILALASAPTINPNDFLDPAKRSAILQDSISRMAFDRATQGSYPPGSTFKMVNGLAAMQMGVIDTATTFSCRHGFRYGNRRLGCHDWGTFRIPRAIQSSCNSFFCKTYLAALNKDSIHLKQGFDEWSRIVKSFGLGGYMGNDLATGSPGRIPSSDYYDKWLGKGSWSPYSIISNGIGQGDIEATPLQMANYTAAIANRGFFFTPHIVREINGEVIKDSNFLVPKKTLVNPRHFDPIIEGMKRVIGPGGTARKIKSKHFTQAGKTGTSEATNQEDHSLFVLMAPVEQPKIVVAVVIENGHYGATWAAPIASLVAEKYVTDTIRRKYLETRMMRGNLQHQYKRNWINYLKRTGQYVEPKIDSSGKDSLVTKY